jgi:hypothetical protein
MNKRQLKCRVLCGEQLEPSCALGSVRFLGYFKNVIFLKGGTL